MKTPVSEPAAGPVRQASAPPTPAARPRSAGRPAPRDASSVVNPLAVLHSLRRRWKAAALVAVPAALSAALAVWMFVPAAYTAFSLLRIAANEPRLVFDTAESKSDFTTYRQTQQALITSRFVLNAAMRKPGVADCQSLAEQPLPINWLEAQIDVGAPKSPEILRIALTGQRPEDLALIVNAVKDAYLEEVVHAERKARLTRLSDLERIFQETDEKLRVKQNRVGKLARQLGTGDSRAITLKQQMALEYFSQLQREYARVRFELMREQLDGAAGLPSARAVTSPAADADATSVAALPAGVGDTGSAMDPETALIARRIVQLRALINRFEKQVVDKSHPALVEYRRQLQNLESQFADRGGNLESPAATPGSTKGSRLLLTRREVLQKQEKVLREEVEKYAALVDTIGTSSFELESMQTELAQVTKVADRINQEIEALRIELQSPPRVALIQAAEVPQSKDLAKKIKLTGLAGFGTLGAILAAFTLLDLRQRRLSAPSEMVDELNIPVLGALPPQPALASAGTLAAWQSGIDEAIDSVRSLITRGHEEAGTRRVLMLASATSGEGKTTVACALAESLARSGRRTLLIDFDLRRPSVHSTLGIRNDIGAAEVLTREIEPLNAVRETRQPGLFVMTAGAGTENALQALTRGEAGRVLKSLRQEFEAIVLDTPPLLLVADAAVLGRDVDAALLSVRRDESRVPYLTATRDRLAALGVPVIGAVMLGVRTTLQQSAYDYQRREPMRTKPLQTQEFART